jgi:putative phosphonate metabolism protein
MTRYAIYFAPAVDSPWWRFGAGWLGWDDLRGEALAQPLLPGFTRPEFHGLTEEPRRYGFHATLKAPFALRRNVTEEGLLRYVEQLANRLPPVPLGALQPGVLDGFVALLPEHPTPAVDALAARCVLDLDPLRAPLGAEEIARRHPERLDAMQRELLHRYGYPHVLGRFRFHMTLSSPVDAVTADLLVNRARERVAELNARAPLQLDRLCVFREDRPGAPFRRIHERTL